MTQRQKYRTPANEEINKEIIALHKQGLRQYEIAGQLHIGRQKVRYHLIKAGLAAESNENLIGGKQYQSENHPKYKLVKKHMGKNCGSKRIAQVTGLSQAQVIFWMRKIKNGSIRKPLYIKDNQPRNTPADWQAYMRKNPYYAELYTKGKELSTVCAETFRYRREMRRGNEYYFLDGLPGEKCETDYSIGYDGGRK